MSVPKDTSLVCLKSKLKTAGMADLRLYSYVALYSELSPVSIRQQPHLQILNDLDNFTKRNGKLEFSHL